MWRPVFFGRIVHMQGLHLSSGWFFVGVFVHGHHNRFYCTTPPIYIERNTHETYHHKRTGRHRRIDPIHTVTDHRSRTLSCPAIRWRKRKQLVNISGNHPSRVAGSAQLYQSRICNPDNYPPYTSLVLFPEYQKMPEPR